MLMLTQTTPEVKRVVRPNTCTLTASCTHWSYSAHKNTQAHLYTQEKWSA